MAYKPINAFSRESGHYWLVARFMVRVDVRAPDEVPEWVLTAHLTSG